jgi:hypothetical protein
LDPVVEHHQRLLALQSRSEQLRRVVEDVHRRIFDRCGPAGEHPDGSHTWAQDPEHPHLRDLLSRSDELSYRALDEAEAILDTPPISLAGARAAIDYALTQMPPPSQEFDEWPELTVRAVLTNLGIFLGCSGAGSLA